MLRVSRTLLYVGFLTLPALVLRPVARITLSDVLFGLSASAAAASVCRKRTSSVAAWQIAAVLTVVGGGLAGIRSVSAVANILITLRLVYIFTVWPWQVRLLLDTRRRMETALALFLLGAAGSGLAAVMQYKFSVGFAGGQVVQGRAVGLTEHVNDQGGLLAIALTLVVGQIVHRSSGRLAVKYGVAGCCAIGLVLSGSVSGMLSALLGLGILALRKGVSLKVLFIGVGVLSIGWAVGGNIKVFAANGVSVTPLERLSTATGGGSEEQNTLASRLVTDKDAIAGITAQPIIGRGLDEASGVTSNGLPVHNLLLLAWLQGGLLVVLAEVVALTAVVRRTWRVNPDGDSLSESLVGTFATALIFSMTAPTLYNRYFWLPAVCLLTSYSWSSVTRSQAAVRSVTCLDAVSNPR